MAAIRLVIVGNTSFGAVAGCCQAGRAEWKKIEAAGSNKLSAGKSDATRTRSPHLTQFGARSKYDKATSHALGNSHP